MLESYTQDIDVVINAVNNNSKYEWHPWGSTVFRGGNFKETLRN